MRRAAPHADPGAKRLRETIKRKAWDDTWYRGADKSQLVTGCEKAVTRIADNPP